MKPGRSLKLRNGHFGNRFTNGEPYRQTSQNYLEIDVAPVMRAHYRPHTMSIWQRLIPKLHLAGSENIVPRQGAGQQDSNLYQGVIHYPSVSSMEVNRAAIGQLTTARPSTPCTGSGDTIFLNHNAMLVKIEEAGEAAYNKAVFPILFPGALLRGANVWFGATYAGMAAVAAAVRKETSCETELMGVSSLSLQSPKTTSFHRRNYTEDTMSTMSYRGSCSPPRKRIYSKDYHSYSSGSESYRMVNGGQAVSFISSHDGAGLTPCLKQSKQPVVATRPRHGRHDTSWGSIQKLSSQLDTQNKDTPWSPPRERSGARSSLAHQHIVATEGKAARASRRRVLKPKIIW